MRTYEVVFILQPDQPESEVDALVALFQEVVSSTGGGAGVDKVEKWGKRNLAYRVAGHAEGYYVFFELHAGGDTLHELERRLKVSGPVIKYLSVRVDLERERLEKLRRRREHRAIRRQRRIPAPSAEVPPAAGVGQK
ncbi:MAG: 30S ribosomal protein S6 [Terriglobia bacterium]